MFFYSVATFQIFFLSIFCLFNFLCILIWTSLDSSCLGYFVIPGLQHFFPQIWEVFQLLFLQIGFLYSTSLSSGISIRQMLLHLMMSLSSLILFSFFIFPFATELCCFSLLWILYQAYSLSPFHLALLLWFSLVLSSRTYSFISFYLTPCACFCILGRSSTSPGLESSGIV